MMACNIQICAIDTISKLFVCLQCWFVKETYTSQCHFQFVKVTPIDKTTMPTRISFSGSYLKF